MDSYSRKWRLLAGDRLGEERREGGYGLKERGEVEMRRFGNNYAQIESPDQWS